MIDQTMARWASKGQLKRERALNELRTNENTIFIMEHGQMQSKRRREKKRKEHNEWMIGGSQNAIRRRRCQSTIIINTNINIGHHSVPFVGSIRRSKV